MLDSRKLMLLLVLVPLALGGFVGSTMKPAEHTIQVDTVTTIVHYTLTESNTQTVIHFITTTMNPPGTQSKEKLVLAPVYVCDNLQYCQSTGMGGHAQTYEWMADAHGNVYLKFTLRNTGSVPVTVIVLDLGVLGGSGQGGSTNRNILAPGYELEYSFPITVCPPTVDWWLKVVSERGTVFTFQIGQIPGNLVGPWCWPPP